MAVGVVVIHVSFYGVPGGCLGHFSTSRQETKGPAERLIIGGREEEVKLTVMDITAVLLGFCAGVIVTLATVLMLAITVRSSQISQKEGQ
jgi:hypothetical protein